MLFFQLLNLMSVLPPIIDQFFVSFGISSNIFMILCMLTPEQLISLKLCILLMIWHPVLLIKVADLLRGSPLFLFQRHANLVVTE